jgi:beta-lactam-binding protein with PASTA domain
MPTMPNVVGQNYDEAVLTLTDAGVYVNSPAYAFLSPPQITVDWRKGTVPGLVLTQDPAQGTNVAAGAALTLTVSSFPMSAVIG